MSAGHCNFNGPLGVGLTDDIVVQHLADVGRRGYPVAGLDQIVLMLFTDDVHAEFDAFVADEHGWPRDELADLVLALAAERAVQNVFCVAATGLIHGFPIGLAYLHMMLAKQSATVQRQNSPNFLCLTLG